MTRLEPAELLKTLVERGDEAVARTPGQLEVLREAGVVDAGGAGLVELVRGLAATASGEPLAEPPALDEPALDAVHQEPSRYRYCTTFVVEGDGLDAQALETELEHLGDSLLVVGDPEALKIHVHTDDPGAALSLGTGVGTIEGVEIADMHRQTEQREQRLLSALPGGASRSGVVAVVAGEGNHRLFEALGAERVDRGRADDEPLHGRPARGGGRRRRRRGRAAAQQLECGHGCRSGLPGRRKAGPRRAAPSRFPAGLAALVAFNAERSAEENASTMNEAAQHVATAEVTVASRDATVDGCRSARATTSRCWTGARSPPAPSFEEVPRAVLERLLAEPRDVLTAPHGRGRAAARPVCSTSSPQQHPELELDVHDGGQPHYPLLLSAE